MSTFLLNRRSALSGSAAAAAAVAKGGYRWRSAAMGGTGFIDATNGRGVRYGEIA
ncbi:hypothetical protein [Streptomyces alanosinicus]|uniref:Uncharacterized protein n=1 Tax=Streptomyces alanosinicus TaxID=68171 RepID=A0A918YRB9_9ACTN|nr:hypothetical protein [Streptomyces alanosinicus]GHE13757.1 hypothetical protein GCM10010339_81800 [Streptomyces alanosinicus]